jgi:hypothetical protein
LDNAAFGLAALNNDLDTLISRLGDPSPSTVKALIDSIEAKLDNGTYGLSALQTLLTDIEGTGFIKNTHSLVTITGYVDEVEGLLKNATYGLSALKTLIDAVEGKLDSATYGLSALKSLIDAIEAKLDNVTYGLSALNTDLDTLLGRLTATRAGYLDNLSGGAVALEATLTAMKGAGWTIETLKAIYDAIAALNDISATDVWTYATRTLTNPASATDLSNMRVALQSDPNYIIRDAILNDATRFAGADISAIKAYVDEVESLLKDATYGLSALNTDLDTVLTRVPAEVTQRAKSSFKVTEKFFADSTRITVTGTAGSQTIKSNFAISLIPSGVTIDYVHILVFSQVVENTNASANKVNGAQYIQVQKAVGGTWTNAVAIVDDALRVPASTRDMGRLLGAPVDCKSEVTGNGNYDLQWTSAQVDLASMYFDDIFFIVEIGFH